MELLKCTYYVNYSVQRLELSMDSVIFALQNYMMYEKSCYISTVDDGNRNSVPIL